MAAGEGRSLAGDTDLEIEGEGMVGVVGVREWYSRRVFERVVVAKWVFDRDRPWGCKGRLEGLVHRGKGRGSGEVRVAGCIGGSSGRRLQGVAIPC